MIVCCSFHVRLSIASSGICPGLLHHHSTSFSPRTFRHFSQTNQLSIRQTSLHLQAKYPGHKRHLQARLSHHTPADFSNFIIIFVNGFSPVILIHVNKHKRTSTRKQQYSYFPFYAFNLFPIVFLCNSQWLQNPHRPAQCMKLGWHQ